ncbi:hypothetical protein HPQ64_00645 [Rhizobiales bacterium]|uniref:hypothetical protein n=1 Tax=Hongsoonwoonella zoysiae TaxID=2821844 RepID=UPI00155F9D24|nr:hypothetical protein [Hongsoonwoonella zoysiae]NRG16192.1 hypothetical protein [Hongsoonwoonella zoysiae]
MSTVEADGGPCKREVEASGAKLPAQDSLLGINLRVGSIFRILALATAGLVVAHTGFQLAVHFGLRSPQSGLVHLFNMDDENNVPTLFSSFLLSVCGVLAWCVGGEMHARVRGDRKFWFGLATIFLFLAADEALRLHEMLISPVRAALGTWGVLHFAWVVPYGALLIVFALAYCRFVFRQERTLRNGMIIAGLVYVSGALGMELIGGYYHDAVNGRVDAIYVTMTTVEETMEIAGLLIFAHTLMAYLERTISGMRLSFTR